MPCSVAVMFTGTVLVSRMSSVLVSRMSSVLVSRMSSVLVSRMSSVLAGIVSGRIGATSSVIFSVIGTDSEANTDSHRDDKTVHGPIHGTTRWPIPSTSRCEEDEASRCPFCRRLRLRSRVRSCTRTGGTAAHVPSRGWAFTSDLPVPRALEGDLGGVEDVVGTAVHRHGRLGSPRGA